MQHAERFGDLERAVMGQQDSTGADADGRSLRRNPGNQDLRRRAGQRLHGVMLGDPVAGVAQPLGQAGQIDGVVQGVCWSGTGRDRRLVNNGKL